MSKSCWLQTSWATCTCRTSVLTSLLYLWISSPLFSPNILMNMFSSAKLISEKHLVITFVWCWEQTESGHFNVVMETRCDCSRCTHIPHLAAAHPICWRSANCHSSQNLPACPNFLFHSVSNYIFSRPRLLPTFVLPPLASLNGDVTLPGELRSLRRKTLICFFSLSHGLGQEPTHWDNRALFTWPGLVKTPTQRARFGVLSHFTLRRNLHSEFSQIVPVQTTGPDTRFTCRILRELMIHLPVGVFLTKMLTDFLWHSLRFPEDSMVFT